KSFFDVVNHDYLMSILYRKVKDERLLRLIRKYLKAGMTLYDAEINREEGTPQGSLCKASHKLPYAKLRISFLMQSK
ncbi:unnamed protein product, partial [marine sediment metagenome]